MNLFCLKCYDVFKQGIQTDRIKDGFKCPKASCDGTAIYLDENLIPVITLLRQKGYNTILSCSSHVWKLNEEIRIWIRFEGECQFNNYLPKDFWIEKFTDFEGRWDLVYINNNTIDINNLLSRQQTIFKAILELIWWVKDLPPNKTESHK